MRSAAVILAGGSGTRMRGRVDDKVLCKILTRPVIEYSARAFLESGEVSALCLVCRDDEQRAAIGEILLPLAAEYSAELFFASGGAERQDSVLNGLRALPSGFDCVLIHDGARPMLGAENVVKLCRAVERCGAAVLAARVSDTIKRAPESAQGAVMLEDLERARLWAMQTPQAFRPEVILNAYERVRREGLKVTDDVAAAAAAGRGVEIVENLSPNPKITLPQDMDMIEFLLTRSEK